MQYEVDVMAVKVPTLEQVAGSGQVWPRMAEKYGASNLVPPWKSSLDGMCDALDHEGVILPLLTRRNDEDRLVHEVYPMLPYPENQLVALTHSLVARHVIDEEALAERMRQVRARLEES
ncbi:MULTISPECIES: thiocyanate hydrolase [unclassified Mycolicibacterium]|uniref:thiocyanate hydrolase n=1 Tax=unclassified Mycolicibacterium TaxID=2636767 RepID=UPI0035C9EB9B